MFDPNEKDDDLMDLLQDIDEAVARSTGEGYTNPYRGKSLPDLLVDFDRQPEPEPEPEAIPVIRAYNADFSRQKPMDFELEPDVKPRRERPRPHSPACPRRRRGKGCLVSLLLLAALVLGGWLWLNRLISPPQAQGGALGARRPNCATILLAGTDQEGGRTDTMMLLHLDGERKEINLVSLPRDTYVLTTAGKDSKLNSAYGRNGRGQEGMEALMEYVADLIGFPPDGYLLIDLGGFVSLVDQMGGVNFDVPVDMFYEDSSQDLYIDLKAGLQKLSGQEAMGLVRFRSGYAAADLQRVNVQREFVSACMEQWLKPTKLLRLPGALSTVNASATTDLTTGNLLWLALNGWKVGLGNLESVTLPGEAAYKNGGSYYLLDRDAVADTVNQCCNPYKAGVRAEDLNIAE